MAALTEITDVNELNLLVAFFDLTSFARFSKNHSNRETFDMLSEYYEFVGDIVKKGGGRVVKFIGDAGLVVYPEENVDRGVMSLKKLKDDGDKWLAERKTPCRNVIQAHFGPVVCGPIGTREEKQLDVLGNTVNTAAMLNSSGFAISPQAFRRLKPKNRKHFKKHTPPVVYIPVEEKHRN